MQLRDIDDSPHRPRADDSGGSEELLQPVAAFLTGDGDAEEQNDLQQYERSCDAPKATGSGHGEAGKGPTGRPK